LEGVILALDNQFDGDCVKILLGAKVSDISKYTDDDYHTVRARVIRFCTHRNEIMFEEACGEREAISKLANKGDRKIGEVKVKIGDLRKRRASFLSMEELFSVADCQNALELMMEAEKALSFHVANLAAAKGSLGRILSLRDSIDSVVESGLGAADDADRRYNVAKKAMAELSILGAGRQKSIEVENSCGADQQLILI